MPKLTIEDLKALRDTAKGKSLLSRDGPYKVKVTVHMGTCGIAAGARKIMEVMMNAMEQNEARDVFLTTSGCAGLCSMEPMATIEFADSVPVKYVELTPDKAQEIFDRHVLKQEPVTQYAIATGSERSI
jgi:NADP-reducing hydrogenase subunit HndB